MADEFTTGQSIAIRITGDSRPLRQALKATETAVGRTGRAAKRALDPFDEAMRRSVLQSKKLREEIRKTEIAAIAATKAASRAAAQAARSAAMTEVRGIYGRVRSAAGTALGFAGTAAFVAGINNARKFEAELTDIQITANKSAEWLAKVRDQVIGVSNATGRGKEEVASYLSTIVTATGNADYAVKSLEQMGKVAVATGADLSDLAQVNVKLGSSFGIAAGDAYKAWNIIRAGEKAGSVTVKAFAQYFGKPASLAGYFGRSGKGLGGLAAFSGLYQLSARAYGIDEPGGAAIGMERFLQRLAQQAAANPQQLASRLGVKMSQLGKRTAKGFEWNALPDVFRAIGEAAAKDPNKAGKYGKTLFGIQGVRVYSKLMEAAQQGWGVDRTQQGGYGSAAALFGTMGGPDELSKDLAIRQKSVAQRYAVAMTRVKNAWYQTMLPVLEKFVNVLPDIGKGLMFAIKHVKELVLLWLGSKLVGAISRIVTASRNAAAASYGAGAGGVAGAAGAGGAGGGGIHLGKAYGGPTRMRQAGSGALMALPLVPFAIEMGSKLGERFAGTTKAAIKEAYRDIAAQDRLNKQWQLNRTVRRDEYTRIIRSARSSYEGVKRTGAVRDLFGGVFGDEFGAIDPTSRKGLSGDWSFNYGKIFAKGGVKGALAWQSKLRGHYAALRSTEEGAVIASGHKGAITDKMLEKRNPLLAVMRTAIEQMDRTLAKIEAARQKGQEIKVHVTATVNLAELTDPASRISNAANVATQVAARAGRRSGHERYGAGSWRNLEQGGLLSSDS